MSQEIHVLPYLPSTNPVAIGDSIPGKFPTRFPIAYSIARYLEAVEVEMSIWAQYEPWL
jgi:hypothetical protein